MKHIMLASAALIAIAGAAVANPTNGLNSAAEVTLETLAPQVDADSLSAIQVNRINREVGSNDGLSRADLYTILAN
ncbi:hypothetical protein [Falsirhodobacter deserti]|uniref:hypothetical protein n=1 Tax=Falsirhodobacter deserti TaxID=1365611 RepID=UPI000FE2B7FD|nr:hypothetical protein [Falsirhodobacter deserti]